MTDLNRPFGPRRPSPVRGWLLLAMYLALIGLRAWGIFTSGHTVSGGSFLGFFVGVPALVYVIARIRQRRAQMHPPREPRRVDPRRQQRGVAVIATTGLAAIGATAIADAKPVDRSATGITVGVALAVVMLVIWANVWSRRD